MAYTEGRKRVTVAEYLGGAEEMWRQELVWGTVVREPASPFLSHQVIVGRALVIIDEYVHAHRSGRVFISPIDVVLDAEKALVLQPDVVFVSNERKSILGNQINGAPDLVVEVASPGTRRRDRTIKLRWYRQYGVRECWLVDGRSRRVTVVDLVAEPARRRRFTGERPVQSAVLPEFHAAASHFFD